MSETDLEEILKTPSKVADPELLKINEGIVKDYELGSNPNSARALKEAKEDNLNVVFPKDNELQIDIDDERAYEIYLAMYSIVSKYYSVMEVKDNPSRSGLPKRHITLTLGSWVKLNPFERIALQTCMGSDRVREILGVVQQMQGDPHPTLFLEKKNEVINAGSILSDGSQPSGDLGIRPGCSPDDAGDGNGDRKDDSVLQSVPSVEVPSFGPDAGNRPY